MDQKVRIKKGTIQETLLLPLWGRAYETRKNRPRLIDENAVEIIQKIDYDFSNIEKTQSMSQHGWVARSLHTDKVAHEFIEKHPKASIVNIGCGLDTTFSRIDNGKIMFYELDLPDVIDLRKNFYFAWQGIANKEQHLCFQADSGQAPPKTPQKTQKKSIPVVGCWNLGIGKIVSQIKKIVGSYRLRRIMVTDIPKPRMTQYFQVFGHR